MKYEVTYENLNNNEVFVEIMTNEELDSIIDDYSGNSSHISIISYKEIEG